jgi:predicted Ser/Thr protein kinase
MSMDQLLVKEKEMHTLKEKILEKAKQSDPRIDYEVAKTKEPYHFLDNLLMLYELAREEKIHVETENPIKDISDKENLIENFTSRSFVILQKTPKDESQVEEVHG